MCPRECGVSRLSGQTGFCEAGPLAEIYSYGPHHGEEPPLSGSRGSGTIFFNRCTLRCLYCQNAPFSQRGGGTQYDPAGFARILEELRAMGCHNWNFVTPTPWVPHIVDAVERAAASGPRLPVVYNTSGFERAAILAALDGVIDVYLGDLRYADATTAEVASGRADYVVAAREALRLMWKQAGPLVTDAQGIAQSGCMCRMLILPGHAGEAAANLHWIADNIGTDIHISLMAQYTPAFQAHETPWNRPISRSEYDDVVAVLHELQFDCGWVQDFGGETNAELLGFEMKRRCQVSGVS